MRSTKLVAAVAVTAAAVAATAATQAASGAPARPAATTKRLAASKTRFAFSVKVIRVRHGKVTLRMSNPSSIRHAIAVEGHGVDRDGRTVGRGGVSTVTVRLKKGRYTFYCPVPGHRAAGMKGRLIVR